MKTTRSRGEWSKLHRKLSERPKKLLRQLGWQAESPLLWGVNVDSIEDAPSLQQRHTLLKKQLTAKNAQSVLELAKEWSNRTDIGCLLEVNQIAYSLDQIAKALTEDEFQGVVLRVIEVADAWGQLKFDTPWSQQLAQVELRAVLALHSVESLNHEPAQMESMIEELVDGDGWILAKHLDDFVPILGSWARCARLLDELGVRLEESISLKLEWMARQWLRLMRPDGTQLLGPESSTPITKAMQAAILNLSTDREDKKLARLRSGLEKVKAKDEASSRLHDGGGFSEWAGVGVFQCGWKSSSPRLAIAIDESGIDLELANRTSLLKGKWSAQISVAGELIEFDFKNHEMNCYHSDDEVELLELEYKSKQGITLQRQVMLARDEQFLLLADAVLLSEPGKIEYVSRLPFASNINPLFETDNREVYLKDSEIHALALPLALGEWKSDRLPGGFGADEGCLQLEQVAKGNAIYCPLFIDLSPKRCVAPRTWRSLTVAEELKILDRDQAVAYRIQVGEQQWVVYRSLSGIANRTFLGENQMCEFFVGKTDGDVAADELIQIE